MDFSKLEELTKMPKKGDAPKGKKKEYLNEMVKLLAEDGYSQQAEKYLVEGFSFCAASPILAYMNGKSSDERFDICDKVVKGVKFHRNEKGISFKIAVNLFCQMINNYPNDLNSIGLLIRDIPNKSKTKEGKLSGDAHKVIEKYLICDLKKNAILPDFVSLNLNNVLVLEFRNLLSSILTNEISVKGIDPITLERVVKWVSIEPDRKDFFGNQQETETKIIETSAPQVSGQMISNKPLKKKELLDFVEYLKAAELRIVATGVHIESLEKGMNTLNSKLSNEKSEIESLKREQMTLSDKIIKKNAENEVLIIEKSKLSSELSYLERDLEIKKSEIADLTAEINKQNSVLSVFSADKKNAQSEQLNAIASKLKAEYLDFKNAIDMEMTLDLGENLRQQINAIFKILAKSKIDVERR